ncbi:class I SAM-dependent methyltransferase [Legionella oakridgensis]|uniref:Methyltransferase domain protein n=2 Tax=Legionella oakridgensis TaxID=29423 RepID=W0BHE4_9GAMM|nr:class I SAM-dependent methyltransferase [Legionella oakridgensis]AHE68146.1 methyltransferase domain protein [Legionella oakridgensis ATCC 33761 = DSM 21215]ETO92360.1 methyltransferase domain protein [Legionella oakridgensis RV-2-2007]KTD37275.1 3-demethylubiquinone-9 3-methyltransferase [Legionella oakridgensis]STY21115.1 3-demethylubiquinone-9 3-methyltransferase [Legionella longbeachae]
MGLAFKKIDRYPHVRKLIDIILQLDPLQGDGLKKSLPRLTSGEIEALEDYLIFSLKQGLSLDYLAHCYQMIVLDFIKESLYFKTHKKYRYSSVAEVADQVYFDKKYMSSYMHGVFISLFFWPNHLSLYRFFRKTIPRKKQGIYLEIGPGHGYFFFTALNLSAYTHFIGIDLSETSIQQTNALANWKPHEKNIQLHCTDFFNAPLEESHFDAIVMGEMLEHVENPQDYLKKIASIAKPEAYIFLTTCINAPAIDHIYQFKNLQELDTLFTQSGLNIKKQCILPYVDKTLEECINNYLAINVGYVLEKKSIR